MLQGCKSINQGRRSLAEKLLTLYNKRGKNLHLQEVESGLHVVLLQLQPAGQSTHQRCSDLTPANMTH